MRNLCLLSKGRTLIEGNIGMLKTMKYYRFNTHLSEGAVCASGGGACNSGRSAKLSGDILVW